MSDALGWGVMGTGNIARQFARDVVAGATGSKLVAVGSRAIATAQSFADEFSIAVAHGSYDALIGDPTVEAIYLSLPNSLHHEWTIKALRAGKHVLCEKPLAATAAQANEMFDEAAKQGRVLVEAFMYRSHPLTHAVIDQVKHGAIGELRMIKLSFCYRTRSIDNNVRFSVEMAGGGLMDIGCYCVSFARLFAEGDPVSVRGCAHVHETGVDDYAACTLQYGNGVVASFVCGMTVQADNTAYLCGTEGYIEVPVPWKPPVVNAIYTVNRATPPRMDTPGSTPAPGTPPRQVFYVDAGKALYALEADDFAAAVRDGVGPGVEPRVTRADTVGVMRVLDELRKQAGLAY